MKASAKNILIAVLLVALAIVSFLVFRRTEAPIIPASETVTPEPEFLSQTETVRSENGNYQVTVSFDKTVEEVPEMSVSDESRLETIPVIENEPLSEGVTTQGLRYGMKWYGDVGVEARFYSIPIPGTNLWFGFMRSVDYTIGTDEERKESEADFQKFINTLKIINH